MVESGSGVGLPGGERVSSVGLGTYRMGEARSARRREVAAVRLAIELGLTVIDTAELYAGGGAEEVVGEAIAGLRERVFVVSKVMPQNAGRKATIRACEASLRRLGADSIDLYLLHWRGSVPLGETIEAFTALAAAGKIRHWGVSNLDLDAMNELIDAGGEACACNQVLYNLRRRGIEYDLMPWLRARGIPVMAYSPVDQGSLLRDRRLARIAREHGLAPATLALAWVLRHPDVIAIPKSASAEHIREIAAARGAVLDPAALAALDAAYPPPSGPVALEMV